MTEPRTKAGKALAEDPRQHGPLCHAIESPYPDKAIPEYCDCGQVQNILAIEAEAREDAEAKLARISNLALVHLAEDCQAASPATGEGLDVERLAEAWGNVMDGRRVPASAYSAARIDAATTTPADWSAIAAEYARLAATTLDPGEAE